MSGRYDASCTSAIWQYEPRYAQIANNENWVIFFNLTQQSTLLQRYLRDERSWWITEIQLVPWIMIMTEQHRSTVYFYRSMICLLRLSTEKIIQHSCMCAIASYKHDKDVLNGKRYEKWIVECKYYINHITYLEMEYKNK